MHPSTEKTLNVRRDPVRDGLVVLCMTVVALALGIGLHLQFALTFWLAVVAALSVYIALLSTHVLVRRSDYVDELRREVDRLESQLGKSAAASSPVESSKPAVRSPRAPASTTDDYWSFTPADVGRAVDRPSPGPAQSRTPSATPYAAPTPYVAPGTPTGHYAHASFGLPTTTLAAEAKEAVAAPVALQRDVDSDADQINAVIKKLAADITQGQAEMAQSAAARMAASQPDFDTSVAALHAVAEAMRTSALAVDDRVEPVASRVTELPPIGSPAVAAAPSPSTSVDRAQARLAAVADAIERDRLDILLEPILGLGDRRAQHYVVTVRLHGELGDFAANGHGNTDGHGSGLLPLIDAIKVERAARVAWRMEDRGKSGSLFSQLAGESLVSDRFLNRFADTYRQGDTLGSRLVLGFRQVEVRAFSELQWSTLRDMADLGFRFCLEDITDLEIDFEALSAAGFTFARLDASVFFDGLPTGSGVVPAADICRHFAGLDLAVIVSGITDEAIARRLQTYGVELGFGQLFGGPRAVKADVLRNPHAAVA